VQPHALLNKTLVAMGRIAWLNADRCPTADTVEEPLAIEHGLHAKVRKKFPVELAGDTELAYCEHDVSHAIDLDCHDPPPLVAEWAILAHLLQHLKQPPQQPKTQKQASGYLVRPNELDEELDRRSIADRQVSRDLRVVEKHPVGLRGCMRWEGVRIIPKTKHISK
jgi:hypothetical protein